MKIKYIPLKLPCTHPGFVLGHKSLGVVAQSGIEVLLGQAALLPSSQTLPQNLFMRHEPDAQPLITALCVCVNVCAVCMFGVAVFFVRTMLTVCLCGCCALNISMGAGNEKLAQYRGIGRFICKGSDGG